MTMHGSRSSTRPLAVLALGVLTIGAPAQSPGSGLRLYESINTKSVMLVDSNGTTVHQWQTQFRPGLGVDLLSDGTLIRAIQDPGSGQASTIGGAGGGVQRYAYDGTLLWNFRYNQPGVLSHHDIEPLPNGNVLLIAWEEKTNAEAIAQGRRPALLGPVPFFLPDHIIEVQPTGPNSGTIVWEWHVWDHLIQDHDPTKANYGVVANHPELIDINYPPAIYSNGDYNHANGIDYDPIHDWIVISSLRQSEIWIIDHSTTTAEAAGHTGGRWGKGGDLLYRWGNPEAYGAGPASARRLGRQHAPRFIPSGYPGAGNLTVFNNQFRSTQSAVFELVLPLDPSGNFLLTPGAAYGPAAPLWSYTTPGLYSFVMSSAQRMPNGNTLICSADQEWVFEVEPSGQKVWERFENQNRPIFHAHYIERALWADGDQLSAAAGGRIDFDLLQGTPAAGNLYLLLCSASGTTPGTPLFGVHIPLNFDPWFAASATYPNAAPIFAQTLGTLTPLGRGSAAFGLPGGLPGGYQLDFSYLSFQPAPLMLQSASNPVPVRIL